jgi:hypothetical protein
MKRIPQITREKVLVLAKEHWDRCGPGGPLPDRFLFAVRGYWLKSEGNPEANDFGLWDDMIAYVTPKGMVAHQANTDPSRIGWNGNAGKPMAVLNVGCWPFRRGPHKGVTPALRQMTLEEARKVKAPNDGRFSVTRTYAPGDKRNYQESGYFAINVHPGGFNGTSSEGCQTLPRDVAKDFLQQVWDSTLAAKMDYVWYLLVEGPIN